MSLFTAVDSYLSDNAADLLGLTRQLVAINSQIPPYGDETEIISFLRRYCSDHGLGHSEVLAIDTRRPNLLVRVPGSGTGPSLMLNAHVDTKPVGDARHEWLTDPLEPTVREGNLYGLGTSDMKAAAAAMIYAVRALRDVGAKTAGDVTLAFVADEEAGANAGSRYLAQHLPWQIDACLIGEPTGWSRDWQGLHLVSRGLCAFRVLVRGRQAHSSLSDKVPSINASLKMAELMLKLADINFHAVPHPYGDVPPTLNVGVLVSGGVYYGVTPGLAEFACDLRTVPGMTKEGVNTTLSNFLTAAREVDPELNTELVYEPSLEWIAPCEIAVDHPLAEAARTAMGDVLGDTPTLTVFPGATDAPWYAQVGIPTLPALGPGILTHCHGPNEFVSVKSIAEAARVYAHTIIRYCGLAKENDRV